MDHKLLERIDMFYKMAAILQAPENMVKEITDWAYSVYCGAMLPIIDQEIARLSAKRLQFRFKDRLAELAEVKQVCEQYYRQTDTNPQEFLIKLTDVPYFSKLEQMSLEIAWRKVHKKQPIIKVELVFDPEVAATKHKEKWEGMWSGTDLLLHQKLMPPDRASKPLLDVVFGRLRGTIRHELQHMVQDYMKRMKALKEWGGLPPGRTRDTKTVDPYGIPLSPGSETPIEHGLRDVEFYTNLADSVGDFKSAAARLPPSTHRALFNTWIDVSSPQDFQKIVLQEINKSVTQKLFGPKSLVEIMPDVVSHVLTGRRFFVALKTNQFDKYRKAVSEFYKAVQSYL